MEQLIPKKLWICFEFTYHAGVKSGFCLCVRLPFRSLELVFQLDNIGIRPWELTGCQFLYLHMQLLLHVDPVVESAGLPQRTVTEQDPALSMLRVASVF